MWRCVVYVCLCYVLVLFVRGGWYSSCSDTQSLFTRQLSQYAASAATPYPHGFIHSDFDGWILEVGEMFLSEEPPPWLGILAKSSLVSECVERACVNWRLHVFCIKILSSSLLTYTQGVSRGGVRDNLIHCVHLKRELELLLRFDSLPSLWRCVVYVCLCFVLMLFIRGGWYSSYSDTRSLFTQQVPYCNIHIEFWKGLKQCANDMWRNRRGSCHLFFWSD